MANELIHTKKRVKEEGISLKIGRVATRVG